MPDSSTKKGSPLPLPITDIIIGQCYRTAAGQERRVLNIFGDTGAKRVRYYARGGNAGGPWDWAATKAKAPTLGTFAEAVDSKIDCPVAAPPPGFDLHGLRIGQTHHDLDKTKYPFAKDGLVTFKVTPDTANITDGDAISDSRHANSPIWVVSGVETVGTEIQMTLSPL